MPDSRLDYHVDFINKSLHKWFYFAFGVMAFFAVLRIAFFLPGRATQYDFNHYYIASRLLLNGQNPYFSTFEEEAIRYGLSPPVIMKTSTQTPATLYLFLVPSLFSPANGFWVWVAVQVLSLIFILGLTWQLLMDQMTNRMFFVFCTLVVSSKIVAYHFFFSQMQLLIAALILLAYAFHRSRHHKIACMVMVVAGALKIYPFLILPWFIWKKNNSGRELVSRIIVSVGALAAIVYVTGLNLWLNFLGRGVGSIVNSYVNRDFNFSIPSFVSTMGFIFNDFQQYPGLQRIWMWIGLILGYGLIGTCLAYIKRVKGRDETEFCLLSASVLAGSGICPGYYFTLLIFPAAVMTIQTLAQASSMRLIYWGCTMILINGIDWMADPLFKINLFVKALVNYLPLCGLLLMVAFFCTSLAGEKGSS